MNKLIILLVTLGLVLSYPVEDYLKDHSIRVRIRNQDTDEVDAKIIRERTTDLLRRQREDDPDLNRRMKDDDLHRREIDPVQIMREREEIMRLTNTLLLKDVEVHLRTYLTLENVDYGTDVIRTPKEEWLTITRMKDSFGGYTIRSDNKVFVPYSMAGYRTTVSPLEELSEDNTRWNVTWTSENTVRLSLGPKRMMKERYPTVNDHHVGPVTLGDLYASQTEYLWTHGEERGKRADFILEFHPDLIVKLDLNLRTGTEKMTKKDCEKLKKHRDCVEKKECEWVDNKCTISETSDKWVM